MRSTVIVMILSGFMLGLSGCHSQPDSSTLNPDPAVTADLNAASFEIAPKMTAREVLPDVFVITHAFPWDENFLLAKMADGTLVLVDTPWTPQAMDDLLDWIEQKYGQPEIVAINSHHHIDNLGGNQALIDAGIPVYGSDLTASLVEGKGAQQLEGTVTYFANNGYEEFVGDYMDMELVPPTVLFPLADGLTLDFGGEKVEIYFPGPSHAPDNVVVYFPDKQLLFGSCMVIGWEQVGNTADANLAAWPEAIEKLRSFDAQVIVPGHGTRLDPQLLDHTQALLSAIRK
ncbi:MAG: metallo-beta-lactamase class [Chloroflexota bacterium]|nr:metallo-beta-lactamase class [Chloroflexota bacterium]